jgi:hypothetical protein
MEEKGIKELLEVMEFVKVLGVKIAGHRLRLHFKESKSFLWKSKTYRSPKADRSQ